MQREILMQRGGDPHADSATAAVPPPRGADACRSQTHAEAPAHSMHGVVQIECLARCSLRTLNKVWKPSVVIIKGHRELLVFRNSSDWAQYRTASVHRGGDIVQAMKAVTPLIKLHIMLSAVHVTDEVKAKEYKTFGPTFGPLHHFTLSETSAEGKGSSPLRARRARVLRPARRDQRRRPQRRRVPFRWWRRRRPLQLVSS